MQSCAVCAISQLNSARDAALQHACIDCGTQCHTQGWINRHLHIISSS